MAPGIGGFNIDTPMQRASLAKGDIAVAHTLPPRIVQAKPIPPAPLQPQRMAATVESGESSLLPKLLTITVIAGSGLLLGFLDEIQNRLSDSLQAITPYVASPVHKPRFVS